MNEEFRDDVQSKNNELPSVDPNLIEYEPRSRPGDLIVVIGTIVCLIVLILNIIK